MAIFGLIFLVIALLLIGLGFAVGLIACAILLVLTALGILTSSAAVGVFFKHPKPAIRLFIYQLFLVFGLPAGVVLAWLTSHAFLDLANQPATWILSGILAGALTSIVMAWVWIWILERFVARISRGFSVDGNTI